MGKDKVKHISLATSYEIDESVDLDRFIKMRLRVCHDGENPNKSHFSVEDMERAKNSIKKTPILAHVIYDEDDQPRFGGHDMVLEKHKMKDDDYKLIYKETPIGVVPEDCNYAIEEFNGKNYVFCDGYIWKGYSNYSEDIIERDEDIKLSMEIIVDEYSYNAKEKVYNITDYRYQGITFLNKNYGTGMENALATTGTFSAEDYKEKFIIMMQELKSALNDYSLQDSIEGGSDVDKINALLEQYGIKEEDLGFDTAGLSVEDVEGKLKELHSQDDFVEDALEDQQNTDISEGSGEDFSEEDKEKAAEDKYIKSFELSHSDIKYALYKILESVEVEDNEWYFIDQVFDDRFEYMNWDGSKIYRQSYKKEDDSISFSGDRVKLFQERLTEEEKEALDNMRSSYTSLQDELTEFKNKCAKFEDEIKELQEFKEIKLSEERKEAEEALFSQFEEILSDVEEFTELKTASSEFSLEELEKELALIVVKHKFNFKTSNKKKEQEKVKLEFSKVKDNSSDDYEKIIEKLLKK